MKALHLCKLWFAILALIALIAGSTWQFIIQQSRAPLEIQQQVTRQSLRLHRPDAGMLNYLKLREQHSCLVEALWFEARGEGEEGIKAVAAVINNRVQSRRYPSSFCEVVQQHMQFSYRFERQRDGLTFDINPSNIELPALEFIEQYAWDVILGQNEPLLSENVLWYAHRRVRNHWTRVKQPVARIGQHVFYAAK